MNNFYKTNFFKYYLLKSVNIGLLIITVVLIISISVLAFVSSIFCIKNEQAIQDFQVIYKKGNPLIEQKLLTNQEICYKENYRFQLKCPKDLKFDKDINWQNFCRMNSFTLKDKIKDKSIFCIRVTDRGYKCFLPIVNDVRLIADFKQEFTEVLKPVKKRVYFDRIEIESLPKQVKCWVKNSLKLDMTRFANSMELNKKQYLFIASGSEFYNVKIVDVFILENKEVIARAKFTKLLPEESESQLFNNPYDLVYIKATGLPVRFVATGDGIYIPITFITGIDYLPNIVAQSQGIKVFTPISNETIARKFSVSGVARIFEATLLYKLFDTEYNKLLDDFVTIGQLSSNFTREPVISNSAINWSYFKFDIMVPETVVSGKNLILKLYTIDPKNGNEINLVVIFLNYNC